MSADQPTADGPTADGPTADGPTADGPTADGPTADGPTADRPMAVAGPEDDRPAGVPAHDRGGRRPSRITLAVAAAGLVAAGAAGAAVLAGPQPPARAGAERGSAGTTRTSSAATDGVVDRRTARAEAGEPEQVDPLAPLPESRARVVAPVAGESAAGEEAERAAAAAADDEMSLPRPKGPATRTSRQPGGDSGVSGLQPDKATALPNGVALPPLEAPEAVMDVIRAGNTIARSPYKWGGGHGNFQDSGYDCSGSVTYALYAAGLIEGSRTSGQLESWGRPGKGRWITVYANAGHTFMEVAGIRFDTSGARRTGSRWQNDFRPRSGYVVRHPPGL